MNYLWSFRHTSCVVRISEHLNKLFCIYASRYTLRYPWYFQLLVPCVTGVGWAMVLISAMICVYYNVIIMYALLYITLSLVNIGWAVPWASCRNEWNNRDVCLETPLPDLESFDSVSDKISHSLGKLIDMIHVSRVLRKPTFWFSTWSNTNQAVKLQKMARGLKFRI